MYDFEDAPENRNKKDLSCVKDFFLLNKQSDEEIRNNTREILRDLKQHLKPMIKKLIELYLNW